MRDGQEGDPMALARRWQAATAATVEPWLSDTVAFDRHRLAEIDAQIAGRPYETDDPGWLLGQGVMRGAATDPNCSGPAR